MNKKIKKKRGKNNFSPMKTLDHVLFGQRIHVSFKNLFINLAELIIIELPLLTVIKSIYDINVYDN